MISLQNEILLLVILLGLSAFFSSSETALTSIGRLRILHLVEKKRKGSDILMKLKDDQHRTLSTILIMNNLVNVSASVLATSIAFKLFQSNVVAITTGAMTLLLLIFGEITPKSMAVHHKERVALFVANPIRIISFILQPMTWVFDKFTSFIIASPPEEPIVTEAEIKTIIKAGEEEGEIDKNERVMIQNIFKFDDLSVKEIMTPRTDMIMIKDDAKLNELLKMYRKSPFSRIPVFKESRDNIVGIVRTRTLLNKKNLDSPVSKTMEEAHFVPETQKIDTLLKQLQKRKQHAAIVVDEHGGVSGIVTMEDALEEIVGDILDEKDKINPSIRKSGKNTWFVQGKTDIEVVNEKLKSKFKEEIDFETIGGYVIDKLGKIPKKGATFQVGQFTITVIELEGNRVKKIKIEKGRKQRK